MRKFLPFLSVGFFILLISSDFFFSSCATRSTPTGGPRDTTAPKIDTSFPPNRSLNFNGKMILIEFNEYISLKSADQQISISPALSKKPKLVTRGKDLEISWTDTLQENTTYTISFGSAIADFTEGNVNDKIKYVFSTGDYLDSLKLEGKVFDSRSTDPQKEFLVALYSATDSVNTDSLAFKQNPNYYTYTDEEGFFSLENLKYGKYQVISFEDKRGNFRLNTGQESIGFLSAEIALTDSTPKLQIQTFTPIGVKRFFGAKHVAYGQIQLAFNYSVDSLMVTPLPAITGEINQNLVWNSNQDTAIYWFKQAKEDSLVLKISGAGGLEDTSVIYLRPFEKKPLEIKPTQGSFAFYENYTFKTNQPIDSIHSEKIVFYTARDTLPPDSVIYLDASGFALIPSKRPKESSCYFRAGAIESFDGGSNDSILVRLKTLRRDELGTVLFSVNTNSDKTTILKISTEKGNLVHQESFVTSTVVNLKNQLAGFYKASLIVDENRDGDWTTGDYLLKRQPERIINYPELIEIRANWEMELLWEAELGN